MTKLDKIAFFWGACDLGFICLYIIRSVIKGKLPFYSACKDYLNMAASFGDQRFGDPILFAWMILSVLLFVSFIPSGILLLRLNKAGALLSYIQMPFRILTFQPSLFFVFWPFRYFVKAVQPLALSPALLSAIVLLISTETIKVISLAKWQKSQKR